MKRPYVAIIYKYNRQLFFHVIREVEVEVKKRKEKILKMLAKAIHDKIMNVIRS